ncbi:hypothetical protein [Pseudooceanicola spongiae]|uniref:Uncharacterized protein n=1 Tax=Pseudooceanicola spongiae TaxID=2613965 RepID=A0A7L9WPW6_9RHOB|nr:hypothetical protein [Pseudooceanicola spongiae]QOL81110.1 hypothetical protein F3W81_09985 [Pseudooceanicola spongiae]
MPDSRNRIFVSVAVSKPDGDLGELPGVIRASERMAAWADAHDYIPLLINDNDFPEVTIELLRTEISKVIKEVTNRSALRRIVIFFAGHGASFGIDDQSWMLSNWDKRPTEAVKVSSLQRMLEYYGPEQVTIIGDACQEFSAKFIEVVGSPVLDKPAEERRDYELDRFFPVDAGSQAFMIKANGEEQAFCLFTEVMLDILEGDAPEKYFETIDGSRHVTSQTLAMYLKDNLATEAGKYGVIMNPRPRPGFYTDRIYYSLPKQDMPASSKPLRARGSSTDRIILPLDSVDYRSPFGRSVPRLALTERSDQAHAGELAEALKETHFTNERDYAAAAYDEVSDYFETGCGICFSGAEINKVHASRGSLSQEYLPPNWYRLELSNDHDPLLWADVVVEHGDGNSSSACIVQNFITAIHVFEQGRTNVLHRKLFASVKEGQDIISLLGRMHAGLLTENEIVDSAAFLRWGKHEVITVGVVASQFYDSIRDTESLRSIAAFYAKNNQPIPLDIVLFGGGRLFFRDGSLYANVPATPLREPRSEVERERNYTFSATKEVFEHPVAGRVPWMRQAWGAIETADCHESAKEWRALALRVLPHLGAGPFTLVKREGRDALLALAGIVTRREEDTGTMRAMD